MRRVLLAFFERMKYGFDQPTCRRCGRPRHAVEMHGTPFVQYKRSIITADPLCVACWGALTPIARLPYYRRAIRAWQRVYTDRLPEFGLSSWAEIEQHIIEAVEAGK
jgi:hypothetical protein